MTNDLPLISFSQRVLDPLIIMGNLYLCSIVLGQAFNGYLLVLMVLAFFISASVYEYVNPYRTWRSGRKLAYARDIITGWGGTVAILVLLGWVTGLVPLFPRGVVLA